MASKKLVAKINVYINAILLAVSIPMLILCFIPPFIDHGFVALAIGLNAGFALYVHCHYLKRTLYQRLPESQVKGINLIGVACFVCGLFLIGESACYEYLYPGASGLSMIYFIILIVMEVILTISGFSLYWTTRPYLKMYTPKFAFHKPYRVRRAIK